MGIELGRSGSGSKDKEKRDRDQHGQGLLPRLGLALNLTMMVGILGTNFVALYTLSVTRDRISGGSTTTTAGSQIGSKHLAPNEVLTQLGSIKEYMAILHESIAQTQQDLKSTRDEHKAATQSMHKILSQISSATTTSLSEELAKARITERDIINIESGGETLDDFLPNRRTLLSNELDEYTAVRDLPLGFSHALNIDTIVSSVGHACFANKGLLTQYMNYSVGQLCPDDWILAQALTLRGCEPLPRRRCLSRTPPDYSDPVPFPDSLWATPPSDTVLWTHYTCKSFDCLIDRAHNSKVWTDCGDCFDLNGPEKTRWMVTPRNRHDLKIEEVLAFKPDTIRVGLDIGGGSGSFAARMREHNVTIVTTTLNLNGPFNEFIALRGLPPLYLSVSQRLPFFDNTMDMVHSMHVLSHWLPPQTLEFLLYDIDRILRPGGLFWLDRFYSTEEKLMKTFIPMIENLGYTKHKWAIGRKTDVSGMKLNEFYFSALLEKPARRPTEYLQIETH